MNGPQSATDIPGPLAAPRPVTPLGILAEKLDRLNREIQSLDAVDPAIKSEMRAACELAVGLDPYVASCTSEASPALRLLAERTGAEDWDRLSANDDTAVPLEQEMLSGHVEGQMLRFLVRMTRARRVLEIGMFTGYSALAMAEALPDDGEVVACEISASVAQFARDCFRESSHGHKITIRVAPALSTLQEMATASDTFDLIFIDADKPGYEQYLMTVLGTGLLAPDGLICVDNTLLQGQPYLSGTSTANGVAIAAFNRAVAADPRVEQVLVPLRDGLTLIRRVDPQ